MFQTQKINLKSKQNNFSFLKKRRKYLEFPTREEKELERSLKKILESLDRAFQSKCLVGLSCTRDFKPVQLLIYKDKIKIQVSGFS